MRPLAHDEALQNYQDFYWTLRRMMEDMEAGDYTSLKLSGLREDGILEPVLDWVLAEHEERIDRERLDQNVRIERGVFEGDHEPCVVVDIDGEQVLVWRWEMFFSADAIADSWVAGMSGMFHSVSPQGQASGKCAVIRGFHPSMLWGGDAPQP